MAAVRLILITLICATPLFLLRDGLVVDGLVAATVAVGLLISLFALQPGEAAHLLLCIRFAALAAAMVVLWMFVQLLPMVAIGLAHPIWDSAATALGHPTRGTISIDPGETLIAISRFLSILGVGFLSAAVAVDRERAEWVLFALVGSTSLIALISLGHDLFGLGALSPPADVVARDCSALGIMIAVAATIRSFERYETRRRQSVPRELLVPAAIASCTALAICSLAFVSNATAGSIFALCVGLAVLATVVAIRRLGLGSWAIAGIVLIAMVIVVALLATRTEISTGSLLLAFATGASMSELLMTERILADTPWAGVGAGNFAAIAPIYREIGNSSAYPQGPTAAATIAIELGRPMLLLIVIGALLGILTLTRSALRRGRDSFYSAAGASCALTLLLLSFQNAGLFATATSITLMVVIGLAIAQSRGRTIQ